MGHSCSVRPYLQVGGVQGDGFLCQPCWAIVGMGEAWPDATSMSSGADALVGRAMQLEAAASHSPSVVGPTLDAAIAASREQARPCHRLHLCFLGLSGPDGWLRCRARAACPLQLPRLQGSMTRGQLPCLRSKGAKMTGYRTYRTDCRLWTRCQSSLCTSCRHHQPQPLRLRSERWPLPTWLPREATGGKKPVGTRPSPSHLQPRERTPCTPRCSLACSPCPSSSCLPRYNGWLSMEALIPRASARNCR